MPWLAITYGTQFLLQYERRASSFLCFCSFLFMMGLNDSNAQPLISIEDFR